MTLGMRATSCRGRKIGNMSEKSKSDAERAILMVAADLLIKSVSSNPEDYPKKFSKKHLRKLEKHYEWQQDMSVKLSSALKILKENN